MKLQGVVFVVLMIYSCAIGLIFHSPLMVYLYFHPTTGRKVWDYAITWWIIYVVAIYERLSGVRILISGTPMPKQHSGLLLINHRTRLDWLFMMSYQLRCGSLQHLKIILKKSARNIPGPGWGMQVAGYTFLHRKWEIDQIILARSIAYLSRLKQNTQLLLFPEGTDLTPSSTRRSNKFAEDNNFPRYEYTLHPKTSGFAFLVEKMREYNLLDSILDIAVAYPKHVPQNEKDILYGNFPEEVHYNVHNYDSKVVPTGKEDLLIWCRDLWARKEKKLKEFYTGGRTFHGEENGTKYNQVESHVQYMMTWSLIYWNTFQVCSVLILVLSPVIRWYSLVCALAYIFTSKYGLLGRFIESCVEPDS